MTVGNHDQPFDRLLMEMDALAVRMPEKVVMQTGHSRYIPRNAEYHDFFPFAEAETLIQNAAAVVGHAGIGTVISCRKYGTPLIICPRRKAFSEHFNDHQLEICQELIIRPRPGVQVAVEPEAIAEQLERALREPRPAPADCAPELKKTLQKYLASL
ncbi:MAG: beta-1,4-galactosyltransferase [Nitrospinae bacterium]|nr:beta-1,4-galactosyltransferase [Nitrospinota bacterium]